MIDRPPQANGSGTLELELVPFKDEMPNDQNAADPAAAASGINEEAAVATFHTPSKLRCRKEGRGGGGAEMDMCGLLYTHHQHYNRT